jgi:spore coat polysaccharide biosynthesis protein SpsF
MPGQRTVAVVQARMGSTRLPGKVLMPLAGRAMVLHVLDRAARIRGVNAVVAAIPDLADDDLLAETVASAGYAVSRGASDDVLARYGAAARQNNAEVIVRITADCPMLSPRVSGRVLDVFLGCDYASNTVERSFPRGLDTEVMTTEALNIAVREATKPSEREHVTPFIYNHPERFRLRFAVDGNDRSGLRWTVDTPEDMAFVTTIYDELGPDFEMEDALGLLQSRPELSRVDSPAIEKPLP